MGHNRNLADYAHHFDGANIDLGSGNIETQGVVTFEDVSNVDAVGIVTARAGVKVPDNQKIFLGTDSDLEIYHDGSNARIRNTTGQLWLQSDNGIRFVDSDVNESTARFTDNGAVELYYDGTKKLETTTTGATVTGTLVSGSVTSELDLTAISSSISDTAVDVFVYDTRKDSDGGAWRKRTQNTSWYNETLGTATRGTRREFPAVAVIVSTTTKVTIYDGDDPDLPMWMVFNAGNTGINNVPLLQYFGQNGYHLAALNGILVIGEDTNGDNWGSPIINFISEYIVRMDPHSSEGGIFNGGVAQRHDNVGFNSPGKLIIVNSQINDVAMTVLPNAPIDDATGLPVPTIAVGTDGGASIIKDDGTVVDITITTGTNYDVEHIDFTDDNRVVILWNAGAGEITIDEIPSVDTSANYPINLPGSYYNDHSPATYSPCFLTEGPSLSNRIPAAIQNFRAVGTTAALSVFEENKESEEDGMVAFISSSYNTGYQQGRIKGAFLSDTDTTDATYTTVADDWATAGAWTKQSSISISSSGSGTSGTLSITGNGTGSNVYFFNPITVEANTDYVVTITFGAYNANDFFINTTQYATSNQVLDIHGLGGLTRGGHFNSGSNTTLYIQGYQVSTTATTITNVVVQKVSERDRSVNSKGIQVFGTVTKSAVATGADLVAYSGFSGSNVLVQPYNSDLDPGTSDYSFMLWFKCSPVSGEQVIMRRFSNVSVTGGMMMRVVASTSELQWYVRDTSSSAAVINSPSAVDDGNWHCAVGTRQGSTANLYLDGVLVTTQTCSANSHDPGTTANLVIGAEESVGSPGTYQNPADLCSLTLVRYSLSAPSPEQIRKIYEDEKVLFQENAKATLYGSSNAVTGLAHDDSTDSLHVGTSAGRSEFQGLRRINNTTDAVTTAISASNGLVAEQ
tara:strand:+ start:1828 stop:4560 length:2733 start_codon:yes stop_codon:yes gene_type:complete